MIKAFLNPLVMWIWIGAVIILIGTLVACIPSILAIENYCEPKPKHAAGKLNL